MNVVVGMPVKDRAWCLPDWFKCVEAQESDDLQLKVFALYSKSEDNTLEILQEHDVEVFNDEWDDRPIPMGRTVNDIDHHRWGSLDTYQYMADMRNRLVHLASLVPGMDYFLSLDSDIMIPEGGLAVLINNMKVRTGIIAPAVNMGRGQTCWNKMNWEPGTNSAVRKSEDLGRYLAVKADVIMAALLMDQSGLRAQWRSHPQGEDVGLCLDCEQKGIDRWWLPRLYCQHLMSRS